MRTAVLLIALCACHSDSTLSSTGLEGDLALAAVSEAWSGETGEGLGSAVGSADLNGDGRPELLSGGDGQVVHVQDDPLRVATGRDDARSSELHDYLGQLRGVGDLDGDGGDEVAAALLQEPDDDDDHQHERREVGVLDSRVLSLLGRSTEGGLEEVAWIDDPHIAELEVTQAAEYFVSGPGDLDGDGYGELWVTQNDSGDDARGRAWLLPGPFSGGAPLSDSVLVVDGCTRWFHLGGEPGGATDWSGDGVPDLAVGSASRATGQPSALFVLEAAERGVVVADEVAFAALRGSAETSSISALPGVGDINGDGHDDLAVLTVGSTESYVAVAWGPLSGDVGLEELSDGLYAEGRDSLPTAVIAGDIDGDGSADLALGSPAPWDDPGRVTLAYGPVSGWHTLEGADATLRGEADGDRVGDALAPLGDGDGDGLADLLIGAPGADPSGSGTRTGAVYAVSGERR